MIEHSAPSTEGPGSLSGLYVAGHGSGPGDGLHRFVPGRDGWEGSLLARVADLSALARHPSLPVLYGVSGDAAGLVHVWDVSGTTARTLTEAPSLGREPCHVAVDPSGRMLVVTNYSSSGVAVWPLAADGSLRGTGELITLDGTGPDPDRQEMAHPHQAVFTGDELVILDLGADVIRRFAVSTRGTVALTASGLSAVPPGTGPRHLVSLPEGDVAVSGELASTVLIGSLDGDARWRVTPSTRRERPSSAAVRNYPGDIARSADGRFVYVANRGYDTIGTVQADGGTLVDEFDVGGRWPQHLLVAGNELLIAARESSVVVALTLADGVPVEQRTLFQCAHAAWLEPIHG